MALKMQSSTTGLLRNRQTLKKKRPVVTPNLSALIDPNHAFLVARPVSARSLTRVRPYPYSRRCLRRVEKAVF